MIRSYIKIAFRNLMRHKLVSFVNIFGLGLSMSIGMMELVRWQDALSYDRHHPYPERTWRVISAYRGKDGQSRKFASTPLPLYGVLTTDTADIEAVVHCYPVLSGTAVVHGKELSINGALTEPSFFRVFGFRLAVGNPATALQDPNSIVLTSVTAKRFFGGADPMGKLINLGDKGNFVVTGVLVDPREKSHLDYDAYASSSVIPRLVANKQVPDRSDNWTDCRAAYTYVLLKKGAGRKGLNGQLNSIAASSNRMDKAGVLSFDLQSITAITPGNSDLYNDIGRGTPWSKLWIEMGVVLLLLIAACFNYTNLTVARALTRAKEVGIRKINGAKRYQLFVQYIVEATVTAIFSLGFASVLFVLIVRYAPFNDGYEMVPSSFRYTYGYILSVLGFTCFTGLLAGVAPAWMLSAFKPLRVLKNLSTVRLFGSVGLQKTLIVFQYSFSLVIIIFLCSFYRQFAVLAAADRGFRRDNVLVVPLNGADKDIAVNTLAAVGGVHSVSGLSTTFSGRFEGLRGAGWIDNGNKNALTFNYFFADKVFIPAMQIELAAGRNFIADSGPDSNPGNHSGGEKTVIINSTAAHLLGFTSMDQAIGKTLRVNDSTALVIIGVVKDLNYENAGRSIEAMAFRNKAGACNYLYIDAGSSDKQAITDRLASAWRSVPSTQPFASSWLDDDLERDGLPRASILMLGYLAFMAVSIATLGLLGLVVYSVQTRQKEISIRKVIGAGRGEIVGLLSRRFIKLLLIAGLVGCPIGFVLSFLFQMNFVLRPGGGWVVALECFAGLLGTGLFIVISQTYRAALENPVKNLKTE